MPPRGTSFRIAPRLLSSTLHRYLKATFLANDIFTEMRVLPLALLALPLFAQPGTTVSLKPGRDANQAIDQEYTNKIREYTTETFFNSPLTDYLPASKNVPTPKAVLGDIAGAPNILPYAADVYRYMRMLEK